VRGRKESLNSQLLPETKSVNADPSAAGEGCNRRIMNEGTTKEDKPTNQPSDHHYLVTVYCVTTRYKTSILLAVLLF
jgi:hypothetical protein